MFFNPILGYGSRGEIGLLENRASRRVARVVGATIVLVLLGAVLDRGLIGSGEQSSQRTLEAMALASGGRERDAVAVGREIPGATYVLDTGCSSYAAVRLGAVAQPAAIYVAALPLFTEPRVSPTLDGSWRSHSWRVYLDDESRRDGEVPILVYCRPSSGNTYEYIQMRFDVGSLEPWADSFISPSRSLARDVLVDFGVFAFLLLLGGALTPRLLGWTKPAVALLVGVALWGVLGLLLLPVWQMAVASIGLALLSRLLPSRRTVGWWQEDAVPAGIFFLFLLFVVNQSRTSGGRLLHTDSMNFLFGGWAFAANSIDASFLNAKRGVVQQALHGPAFLAGVEGLQSLYLVAFYVGLWLLVAATADLVVPRRAKALMVALALALLLLLSPFMVRAAALVNSHVLVGALLLALVVLWAGQTEAALERPAIIAMSLLSSAVILLRPEGVLVVGLLLLGTLWRKGPRVPLPIVWRAAGSTSIAWGLLLASGRSGGARLQETLPIVLGLFLVLGPTVLNRFPARLRDRLPGLTLGGMWIVVGVLLALRGERVRFFGAAQQNVLAARGEWGSLGVTLLILTIGAVAVLTARGLDDRWGPGVALVVGFAPPMMFAKMADNVSTFDLNRLLSGGGRVGYFDSVNRMWIHIVFVALLLVVVALARVMRSMSDDGPLSGQRASEGVSAGTEGRE